MAYDMTARNPLIRAARIAAEQYRAAVEAEERAGWGDDEAAYRDAADYAEECRIAARDAQRTLDADYAVATAAR